MVLNASTTLLLLISISIIIIGCTLYFIYPHAKPVEENFAMDINSILNNRQNEAGLPVSSDASALLKSAGNLGIKPIKTIINSNK